MFLIPLGCWSDASRPHSLPFSEKILTINGPSFRLHLARYDQTPGRLGYYRPRLQSENRLHKIIYEIIDTSPVLRKEPPSPDWCCTPFSNG